MNHTLSNLLIELGLSKTDSFELFNKGVRDRTDINAYRCKHSGVIVLDSIAGSTEDNYKEKQGMEYFQTNFINNDDEKRAETYIDLIRGKSWLDFGCGQGGPSLLLKDFAKNTHGLELQQAPRDYLNSKNVKCVSSLDDLEDDFYDIMTMFHVYEHLPAPVELLKNCYKKLKKGGLLIIEVPHANDALLSLYDSEPFKKFTLWSEHLILHTKKSLEAFITQSNFKVETVKSLQRYPLANHLYWLSQNKPGGHQAWSFLNSLELEIAYTNALSSIEKTDTIVAYCRK